MHFGAPSEFTTVTDTPNVDLLMTKSFAGSKDIPGNVEIIGIQGSALVVATVYGSKSIQDTALGTVKQILSGVHLSGDGQ